MLRKEDEVDVTVRPHDQSNINEFGRLNARLHEATAEKDSMKKKLEHLDDASTELMMGSGGTVSLLLGDAFITVSEEDATEFCEEQVEKVREDSTVGERGEREGEREGGRVGGNEYPSQSLSHHSHTITPPHTHTPSTFQTLASGCCGHFG
jgi:chaperonin cofactor prefoldin